MPSPLRGTLVGFLDDLYVIPQAWWQGVVDVLYEGLNQLGRDQGWPFIRWITAETITAVARSMTGFRTRPTGLPAR